MTRDKDTGYLAYDGEHTSRDMTDDERKAFEKMDVSVEDDPPSKDRQQKDSLSDRLKRLWRGRR